MPTMSTQNQESIKKSLSILERHGVEALARSLLKHASDCEQGERAKASIPFKPRELIVETYSSDEGASPDGMRIDLTESLLQEVLVASVASKALKVDYVRLSRYPDTWIPESEENRLSLEDLGLFVSSTCMWVVSQPEDTDYRIQSVPIRFEELLGRLASNDEKALYFGDSPDFKATIDKLIEEDAQMAKKRAGTVAPAAAPIDTPNLG